MDPGDFLDVADEWAGGTREAEWRSAVSRAYYAAFDTARQLLQAAGFVVPQAEQAPAYLWLRLANAGHPDIQRAGNDLRSLRRQRNWADYDLDQPLDDATAAHQVLAAADLLQTLQSLRATPVVLAQVVDTMKIYERDVLKQVTWAP
jgi:uncharacterized protein (UPF0332 family)